MGSSDKTKAFKNVFDDHTREDIERLSARHLFDELTESVALGKEANIFSASTPSNKEVILKIYRVQSCNFNKMYDYLTQDPRFIGIRKQKRSIVYQWTKREFRNLLKARELGVRVPKPIDFRNNIIIMEKIEEKGRPARQLKDIDLRAKKKEDVEDLFMKIAESMRLMHQGGLVHGDLSSFNILVSEMNPILIDFSQGTLKKSPDYKELLERDIRNVSESFKKAGITDASDRLKEALSLG